MTPSSQTTAKNPITSPSLSIDASSTNSKITGVSIQDVNALIGRVTKAIGDLYATPKPNTPPTP